MKQWAWKKNANSLIRTLALIQKEGRQMLRDKSTLLLGIVLPVVLLFIFGFGLSLDVTLVPVTVVQDETSEITRDVYTSLKLSPYFNPTMVNSMAEAEKLLLSNQTNAIVRLDTSDANTVIQVIINGRDSNNARTMLRYLEGAITRWSSVRNAQYSFSATGVASIEGRVWYNHAMESQHFLVPGVTVLIMTIIGSLLTALVIAREWERGTYETLIASPAKPKEIIIAKIVPYLALGMLGLFLCLACGYWIFQVPIRGSLFLIILASAIYLLVALGIGLFISAVVKSQFLASQIVILFSFLPTVILSGFIFDLQSAPRVVFYFAHIFPATWYVEFMQTIFLAGNIPEIVIRNIFVLTGYAVITIGLASTKLRKTLE